MPCVNTLQKDLHTVYVFDVIGASRARHKPQGDLPAMNSSHEVSLTFLLVVPKRHWPLFSIIQYVDQGSSSCQLCLVTGQEEGLS